MLLAERASRSVALPHNGQGQYQGHKHDDAEPDQDAWHEEEGAYDDEGQDYAGEMDAYAYERDQAPPPKSVVSAMRLPPKGGCD